MENETACGCGCVDVLGQGPETCAFLSNNLNDGQQVLQGATKAIIFCDRHHVAWAKVLQQGLQFWTLRLGTGNLFGPDTLGSSIFQCSDLSIEMLILCRYPRISQDHSKNLQQPL